MKENKKVSPSLGVCGRNGAAAKSILLFSSGRKNLNHFGLRALLVVLLGVFGIGNAWAIDWASLGETPAANGQYYVYNKSTGYFIINNGTSSNATLTNNPAIVDGKYFTLNGSKQVTIRNSNNNRTCAITYVSSTEGNTITYTTSSWFGSTSSTTNYFYTNGATLSTTSSTSSSYANRQHWIFIPVDVFEAQKTTLYYTANAAYASASQSDWGTIKVSANNSTWVDEINKSEGEQTFGSTATVYFKATAASDMYRFVGWKTSPEAEDYISTNATYAATFDASTDGANPTAYVLYADFQKKNTIYAKAITGTNNSSVGSAKVAFSNTIPDNQTEVEDNHSLYGDSYEFTAYFEATAPAEGYEFAGWSRNISGTRMIGGAVNLTYNETFEATSLREAKPTTLEIYAIYTPVSNYEAQAIHVTDEGEEIITPQATLAEAISFAQAGDLVQLLKNISLASAVTIDKDLMLDLNGYSINGSTTLLNISAGKVTITDGNQRENNAIRLTAASASALSAVTVSGGDLTFHQGLIAAANSGAGAVSGVLVNSGSFLAQGNNTIQVEAASGYSVQVAGGEATLYSGTINATGGAIGVLTSAKTAITNSIKINVSGATNIVGVRTTGSANVTIDGGVISATATGANAYAIQAQAGTVVCDGNMEAKASAASGAYALEQEGSTKVTVNTGRFWSNNTQDIIGNPANNTNLKLGGGYYVHNTALATYKSSDKVGISDLTNPKKFKDAGYKYILSDGENPNYVAFKANNINFSTLEDALDYANQNSGTTMTILQVVADYTFDVPGNYTLPANATLLIPYQGQTAAKTSVERVNESGNLPTSANCILRMASGVTLNAFGNIEVGCKQNVEGQGESGIGCPVGTFGQIIMSPGSKIILSGSSSILRAWGFITGDGTKDAKGTYLGGEIDVRRGATVREQFQMQDWKGGSASSDLLKAPNKGTNRVFPVCQYFVQNVEVRAKYHPGAKLIGSAGMYVSKYGFSSTPVTDAIGIIGARYSATSKDDAMFLMQNTDESEDTWVCKWYDVKNDKQVYEVNNSAELGNLAFDLSATVLIINIPINMNSADYILPITNNMKIHLLTGEMDITQDTEILPGAEIEIDKESTVTIASGKNLYLYDADQWYDQLFGVESGNCIQRVKWRPGGRPNVRNLKWSELKANNIDAVANVHGTFNVDGMVWTTSSGAQIISSVKDAGTINILTTTPSEGTTKALYQINGASASSFSSTNCVPAKLQNSSTYVEHGGDEYISTAGTDEYLSFCYVDIDGNGGRWTRLAAEGCFVRDDATEPATYYAKPKEYVKVKVTKTDLGEDEYSLDGNTNHTFSYYDQEGNLVEDSFLICMPDCQWWKVVPVEESDSLFYCPINEVYYYWNPNRKEEALTVPGWEEKRFTVRWENWDGTLLANYQQVYKSIPSYQGATPQRTMTTYYTYAFNGWMPEIMPVTKNITYTAQFEERDRKYTITFLDEDGISIIETQQCKIGEVPVCYNMPSKEGMRLEWLPYEPIAVSGAATYTAHFTEEEKTAYTITFFDFNGTVLQSGEVAIGEMPVYDEENGIPSKPSIAGTDYEWSGWTPEIVAVEANATYTAAFTPVPAKYDIKFYQQDGTTQIGETQRVAYGELPAVPDVSALAPDDAPEGHYYEVVWNPGISVAVKNQNYTIQQFDLKRGKCSFTMIAGENGKVQYQDEEPVTIVEKVEDYGTEVTIEAKPNANYRFVRWSDGNTTARREGYKLSSTTLRAEFALAQYTITWKDHEGNNLGTTIVNHGETPSYPAPARAADQTNSYSFAGWNTTVETPGNAIVEATADATYYATYTSTPVEYTLRFIFDNGREDFVKTYGYNAEPVITNPAKISLMGVEFVFTGWKNNATEAITEAGVGSTTLPAVTGNASYTAQYLGELVAGGDEAEKVVLDDPTSLEDLTIHTNGYVEAYGGAPLTVNNLYLEATSEESGQLLGSNVSAVNAYFDWTMNGTTGSVRRTWYAVAVPWEVNAETGILDKATGRTLVAGRDFDLIYYSGADRAANGNVASNWQYVQWDIQGHDRQGNSRTVDKLLHPGRLYMMYFAAEGLQTVRFVKADGAAVMYTTPISVETYTAGDPKDANWNGIANPRTYYATIDVGNTYAQVLNNGNLDDYFAGENNPVYQTINLASSSFMVGKPLFVQALNATPVVINKSDDANIVAAYAPRRARAAQSTQALPEGIDAVYQLTIAAEGKPSSDNLFVQVAEDEKADKYVIGKDLSKGGVAAKRAQMWVDRYNTKLSVNTLMLVNDEATYPLVLFAPTAGDYTISNIQSTMSNEDYDLYLTLDGEAIWNLSNSAYTLSLPQGNTAGYGLRISRKKGPQVATGIDEAIVDANGEIQKVLINGKVFIIRGNNVYSVHGQLIR